MPPHVTWTRRAEREAAASDRREIDTRLQTAFGQAGDVVVLNYYVGFKRRDGEHILRVDVREAEAAHTYVVKIAGHDRLAREYHAWKECRIDDPNPVFMPLHAVADPDKPGRFCAIAYQDAESHIGLDYTFWLERAVQECVRFNRPTLPSVLEVLHTVYAQVRRLHRGACLEPARNTGVETMPRRGRPGERHLLNESLPKWSEPGELAMRRQVNAAFPLASTAFLDPVDYFAWLDCEQKQSPVLPDQLRGRGHGDLHGRNLLVGMDERERACFPGLFDYENIHPDNLVGWDFVEMETELKIRCYDRVFPQLKDKALARAIQEFEWKLAEATRDARWPDGPAADSPADRLFAILMAIRQEAFDVLGPPRAGRIDWLHEYLFLLGAYGLTTVRYPNQSPAQRTAAFLSAGVAAAFWESLRGPRTALPADADPELVAGRAYCGYRVPLQVAWAITRGPADLIDRAETLLERLMDRYPAALHVWYERALNLVKDPDCFPDAVMLLDRILIEFGDAVDEDTLALAGRCHKDRGDRDLRAGLATGSSDSRAADERVDAFEEADEEYSCAIDRYRQAYALAGGFFPGINVATLLFLRGGLQARFRQPEKSAALRAQARALAGDILAHPDLPEILRDDDIWKRATKAEAEMVCGQFAAAARHYARALQRDGRTPHHLTSMGDQFRRLVAAYRLYGAEVPREPFAVVPELASFFPT